ncbi:MAG: carbon storage regulator [Pirellulales bacterium]|nr:carbon storage regulator [Pirellulales bacterium]
MLVLSRKESQKIKLGDSIVVTVVRTGRDRVQLGIDAPSDVLILREELLDKDRMSLATAAEKS